MRFSQINNVADAKTFGQRLRWLRRFKELTLQNFASRIGCNAGYLSHLENGKAKNPSERFIVSVVVNFRVSGQWLRTGDGDPFWEAAKDSKTRESLPDWSEKRLQRIMAVLDELPGALAIEAVLGHLLHDKTLEEVQSTWKEIRSLPNLPVTARLFWNDVFMLCQVDKLPASSQTKDLTESATSEILAVVKAQLPRLRERLNRATKETGKMSALAEFLGVPLASVSRWLSGKREPGGEITLKLLHWVEQQERQK
jgi:transcriptional regulator with XRE-family HTH domain